MHRESCRYAVLKALWKNKKTYYFEWYTSTFALKHRNSTTGKTVVLTVPFKCILYLKLANWVNYLNVVEILMMRVSVSANMLQVTSEKLSE